MNNNLLAMIFRNDSDYTVWYPEIPSDEPLLVELLEKYVNNGGSTRGSKNDIVEDLSESL